MKTSFIRRLSSAIPPRPPLLLKVKRSEPTMVAPATSTPRELKPLSDLDNLHRPFPQVPFLMLFKHNSAMVGKDPAKVIRQALEKALVPYYPLAGRLVETGTKLLVDCTSEGVPMIEAEAENELDHVINRIESGASSYFEELQHEFSGVRLGCTIGPFQVTRFRCGGFALSLPFHHAVIDGSGVAQFLSAMAEYARGAKTLSVPPVWKRDFDFLAMGPPRQHVKFEEIENISPEATIEWENNIAITRSLYFRSEEITALKNNLENLYGKKYTTFEVLSACLWRSRTRALKLDPNQIVEFRFASNLRYQKHLELPRGYYGNAVALASVYTTSGTLGTCPLEYALELIKKKKAEMNGDYLRATLDDIIRNERLRPVNPWMLFVTDTRSLGIEEADFGWGKPVFGCSNGAPPWGFGCSRFKDGVHVVMCMPQPVMQRLENELRIILETLHNVPIDHTKSKD